jgi:hypothetical protein
MKKLLLVVLASFMLLALFAGCAAAMPQEDSNGNYYSQGEVAEAPAAEPGYDKGDYDVAPQESAVPAEGSGSSYNYDNSILQPGVDRKIIYEGTIEARTKKYDEDLNTILNKLRELGGYQENASTTGTPPKDWQDQGRTATLTLRVPSEHFDDFMNVLKGLGETVSTSVNGRDVSEAYFDTETRLSTLRIQESRLQDLLKQAATLEDIIEIEKQLEETTYQIESLQSQLRGYDSLIDFSTVTVYLTEVNDLQSVKPTDEPLGDRISSAFYAVLNALAKFGEGLLIFFIGGSPIIVPLVLVGVILLIIFGRKRKKRAAQKNNQTPMV